MIRQNRCKIFTLMISMLLVCALCFAAGAEEAGIKIDEQNFPDAAFRSALLQYDTNNDRELSKSEIYGITELNLMSRNLKSLQGIEYLTELKELMCGSNKLKTLDVSKNTKLTNLYCGENELTELDVSNNPDLEELNFVWNNVRTIDTSNNSKLKDLAVSGNPVGELDLSNMPDLEELFCPWSGITELDVSYNPKLYYISAIGNALTKLDLSYNPKVRVLMVENNGLETLDISNCPDLISLVEEKEAYNDTVYAGPGTVTWTVGDNKWGSGELCIDSNVKLYTGVGEYAEAKVPEVKAEVVVVSEEDTAVEYTNAFPELTSDVEKEILFDFFCKWSQGDTNELPESFVPAQRTSSKDVKAIVKELLELGKPVSFQINKARAGSNGYYRAYQCTLEMAHEDGEPVRFIQIEINVSSGAVYGVDVTGMKTVEPAEYNPGQKVYSLAPEAVVRDKLASTLQNECAEGELLPIGKSVENLGMRVELISGLVRGNDAWIYYTVDDLPGEFDDYSFDTDLESDIGDLAWYSPKMLYHDIKNHKFYNLMHINFEKLIDTNERDITLTLNHMMFRQNGWADLSEAIAQCKGEAKNVKTAPFGVMHSDYTHEDKALTEDEKKILDCSESLDIWVRPRVVVTGLGWIDGKLHVQIRSNSECGYNYVNLLANGMDYYFSDARTPYSPLYWYEGNMTYDEYVLDYKQEDAEQLKLTAEATTSKGDMNGNWTIQFPLSTICPDVKTKTEEKADTLDIATEKTVAAAENETKYISSYSDTLDDYKKYNLWSFFCRWAQGYTKEMPYSFTPAQKTGGEETQRKINELLKLKPLSYRIDDVKDTGEKLTYYCTVEMEADENNAARYEQVAIAMVKNGAWIYYIDLDDIQFLGAPESLPTDNMISLSREAIINDQLDYYYQGVREKLQPIGETHDCKGIRMEVISGYGTGNETWYLYSLQDLEGRYEDFSPDTWDIEDDIAALESYQHSMLYCDRTEKKCYYMFHMTHESTIGSDEQNVKLMIRSIHFDSNGWADLIPLLKEHMEPVEGVHPTGTLWDSDWDPDKELNPEDYKVLDYTKPLNIEVIPGAYVTGIGWLDNQLHVQIRMANDLDGYSKHIESYLNGIYGYDRQVSYTPLSWSVGSLCFEEYIYNYTPEDIEELSLILNTNIARDRIDGPWVVRFPLSAICPDVKEKAEESGTTWQDFGEPKDPETTEPITDENTEPDFVPFDEKESVEEEQTFTLELKDGAFVLTQGDISYRLNDDGTATIVKIGKEFGEAIEIPETVTVSFEVNGVDYKAFLDYINQK